jgi:hypothetical protein
LPLTFLPSTPARNGLLFRRRAPDRSISRRLVWQLPDESTGIQQRIKMKYLLMIIVALALVGTANATSRSADCCGGKSCCPIKLPCCASKIS